MSESPSSGVMSRCEKCGGERKPVGEPFLGSPETKGFGPNKQPSALLHREFVCEQCGKYSTSVVGQRHVS